MRNFLINLLALTLWAERTSPDRPDSCPLILVFDEAQQLDWGEDSIAVRKKTVRKDGKEYTYWEARYTEGYHPGTGRQIQRSITGKTQKEVTQKLKAATASCIGP